MHAYRYVWEVFGREWGSASKGPVRKMSQAITRWLKKKLTRKSSEYSQTEDSLTSCDNAAEMDTPAAAQMDAMPAAFIYRPSKLPGMHDSLYFLRTRLSMV